MRLLLDTQVLLWTLADPRRLDRETRGTIESGDTEVLFSAASIWEIAIKASLGRDDFAFDPAEIAQAALDTGFSELAVRVSATALVARLPFLHRDPFDRLLVAQAMAEPVTLYTADAQLVPYSDLVRRIGASDPHQSD
jgi:PIN domain nuclease of toxin-antitoxin system